MTEQTNTTRRRQASKPMLERQRRARINNSLDELKSLVLSALHQESAQYNQKMEKAEILQLAVNFLKMSRGQRSSGPYENSADCMSRYRAGYNDCTARIFQYFESDPGISGKLREKVLSRLATFCYTPTVDCAPVSFCPSCATNCTATAKFRITASPYGTAPSSYYKIVTPPPSPISYGYNVYEKSVSTRTVAESVPDNPPLWRPWLVQPKTEDK